MSAHEPRPAYAADTTVCTAVHSASPAQHSCAAWVIPPVRCTYRAAPCAHVHRSYIFIHRRRPRTPVRISRTHYSLSLSLTSTSLSSVSGSCTTSAFSATCAPARKVANPSAAVAQRGGCRCSAHPVTQRAPIGLGAQARTLGANRANGLGAKPSAVSRVVQTVGAARAGTPKTPSARNRILKLATSSSDQPYELRSQPGCVHARYVISLVPSNLLGMQGDHHNVM